MDVSYNKLFNIKNEQLKSTYVTKFYQNQLYFLFSTSNLQGLTTSYKISYSLDVKGRYNLTSAA